jgi:hypothetical protein
MNIRLSVQRGIEKCNIINELNECSGRMRYFEDLIKRKKRILNSKKGKGE